MVTRTTGRKVQLSATVRPELKILVEELANENNTTKSSIISQCLEEIARKRTIKLMEEGYREMAEENKLLAEQSLPIALETWPRQGVNSK